MIGRPAAVFTVTLITVPVLSRTRTVRICAEAERLRMAETAPRMAAAITAQSTLLLILGYLSPPTKSLPKRPRGAAARYQKADKEDARYLPGF